MKEELEAKKKMIEQLKEMVKRSVRAPGERAGGGGVAVTALPAGDKGKVIEADNENMFAIVEFSEEAMKQLRGEDLRGPLPLLELGLRRPGFNGEAGEFVGRVRLRQEVQGKPYVICDILGAWEQDKVQANDILFAD